MYMCYTHEWVVVSLPSQDWLEEKKKDAEWYGKFVKKAPKKMKGTSSGVTAEQLAREEQDS